MAYVGLLTFMANLNALACNLVQQFREYHFSFQYVPMTEWEQIPESRFLNLANSLIKQLRLL